MYYVQVGRLFVSDMAFLSDQKYLVTFSTGGKESGRLKELKLSEVKAIKKDFKDVKVFKKEIKELSETEMKVLD